MRQTKHWLLLVSLLVLSGCVGSADTVAPPDNVLDLQPTTQELLQQLPPFPTDDGKQSTGAVIEDKVAKDTYNSDESVQTEGDTLILSSQEGVLSWAVWQFSLGQGVPQNLDVLMSTEGEGDIYVALADYTKRAWSFSGPFAGDAEITLDSDRHKSPVNNVYVAVMTYGGDVARVESLKMTHENGWTNVTLDSEGVVGSLSSMVVVNGNPAIAYFDETNAAVKYVRAANVSGTLWGNIETVDDDPLIGGALGECCDLAVVEGKPAVCFESQQAGLQYLRATDDMGTNWDASTVSFDGEFQDASLAIVNDLPALSYFDNKYSGGLKYVQARDAVGNAWGAERSLTVGFGNGWSTSLAVENENPVIAFHQVGPTFGNLMLIGATDPNGTNWNPVQPVDGYFGRDVGTDASGAIVAVGMSISYYHKDVGDLLYARYNNQATEWEHVIVDSLGDTGLHSSLAVIDGFPAISYYKASYGLLKYVRALDNKGTAWGKPVTVDSLGDVGQASCLVDVDGRPAICYFDATNGDLKYAIQAL